MIRINLLPFRAARQKENVRQQVSIFLLSFALILITMVALNSSQGNQIDDLEIEIDDSNKKLAKFNKINIEIAVIKKQLRDLNQKIDIIGALESDREGPVRLLDAMTDILVPKRMWFTSLQESEITESPEKTSRIITINGVALDNKTVADFMKRLEASELFSSVNLITLKQEKKNKDSNLKSFQINCGKIQAGDNADEDKSN